MITTSINHFFHDMKKILTILALSVASLGVVPRLFPVFAAGGGDPAESLHSALLLFGLAGILIAAKVLHLIEKIKQPPVVGELLAGIVLGNLAVFGLTFFSDLQHNTIVEFLAELGVILLLFQIGLESNVRELAKVGTKSLTVAVIGAFLPFVLATYVVGPLLLPGQSSNTYLFLGATLIATSVGISSRIFKDMGKMKTQAAKIFLGATVTDDVISLVMLAVVSALVISGSVSPLTVGLIVLKSVLFLGLSVVLGQLIAPRLSHAFSLINTGMGTKFTVSLSICLTFAGIAQLIGLEPIIGAFAAGLILDPVHFKRFKDPHIVEELKEKIADVDPKIREKISRVLHHHAERSVEDIIEPLALFFVPIFFVVTGMQVNIQQLLNPQTLMLALVLSVIAFVSKIAGGLILKGPNRWIVGIAMIPRGEVGLIFANVGKSLGVLSDQVFAVLIVTILITTIVAPALLTQKLQALQE